MNTFYSWKHNWIRLNSRIGIHEEGTNITNQDKSIRLDWNLIHRMTSSKTTQKPASTAWYPALSRFIEDLASLNPQHVTTQIDSVSAIREHVIHVLFNQGYELDSHKDHRKDRADPNQSRLGKEVLHEFKHKVRTQRNTGQLNESIEYCQNSIEPITSFKLDLSLPHGSWPNKKPSWIKLESTAW
jgi:hypothetical protein